jgi:hypothetical protein
MLPSTDRREPSTEQPFLAEDFSQRLETALRSADQRRWRLRTARRAKATLPWLLLIGPLVAWRLTQASPDGVHVGIGAVAWIAFLLDVGVHADTVLLSYLGLQALPSIVGVVLLLLVTGWLLSTPRGRAE